ncbi:Thiamin-phosphate pyrophosphorylase [Rhodovulum sp. PH10]|nr:Thiamin-phosphate pyrophosphorylase [Rhodovulum sp. PH10]
MNEKRLPHPPLLLVTDRRQAARPLAEVVAAALAAGCRWVSLREKDLGEAEQAALIAELRPRVEQVQGVLSLHGDPALAARCGVGVHLPATGEPRVARDILGAGQGEAPRLPVGVSVHSPAEAARLDPRLVDYAIAGPAFATASKPGYGPALGPAGVSAIVRASAVPVVAIGGVTAETIPSLLAAGAAGVAVMGGVMRANNPAAEVRRLLDAIETHRPGGERKERAVLLPSR